MSHENEAQDIYESGLKRAADAENAPGQIFPKGTRVKILDVGWPAYPGLLGTVEYSYTQAYGNTGNPVNNNLYAVDVDGHGSTAWYTENQLEIPKEDISVADVLNLIERHAQLCRQNGDSDMRSVIYFVQGIREKIKSGKDRSEIMFEFDIDQEAE